MHGSFWSRCLDVESGSNRYIASLEGLCCLSEVFPLLAGHKRRGRYDRLVCKPQSRKCCQGAAGQHGLKCQALFTASLRPLSHEITSITSWDCSTYFNVKSVQIAFKLDFSGNLCQVFWMNKWHLQYILNRTFFCGNYIFGLKLQTALAKIYNMKISVIIYYWQTFMIKNTVKIVI